MRMVADELGVSAMAAYRHVPSREALISLVTDRLAASVSVPAPSTGTWDERLRQIELDAFAARAAFPASPTAPNSPAALSTTASPTGCSTSSPRPDSATRTQRWRSRRSGPTSRASSACANRWCGPGPKATRFRDSDGAVAGAGDGACPASTRKASSSSASRSSSTVCGRAPRDAHRTGTARRSGVPALSILRVIGLGRSIRESSSVPVTVLKEQ